MRGTTPAPGIVSQYRLMTLATVFKGFRLFAYSTRFLVRPFVSF
jgi:hypothetical protein